ncbi:MAG: hypothetical protein ACRDZO_08380 [Egibacteraceae bacterium]
MIADASRAAARAAATLVAQALALCEAAHFDLLTVLLHDAFACLTEDLGGGWTSPRARPPRQPWPEGRPHLPAAPPPLPRTVTTTSPLPPPPQQTSRERHPILEADGRGGRGAHASRGQHPSPSVPTTDRPARRGAGRSRPDP